MELISIIVPVYNVEQYLGKCLDSIINQTYKNLEIILVDDGSTDNSGSICDDYSSKDERIQVIHRKNGGLSVARNTGIDASKGKFIMFVDSDDYIDTEIVEFLYSQSIKYNSDISLCGFNYVSSDGKLWDSENITAPEGIITRNEFWKHFFSDARTFYVTMWAKLYRRSLWDKLRFPVGKLHEDEYVIHELIENSDIISISKRPLYYYLQRDNSIVGSTFRVGNLDSAEGMMIRCRFFIEKKDFINAEKSLTMALYRIARGYKLLSPLADTEKSRIKEVKKEFCSLYFVLLTKKITMLTKIKYATFCISIKLFNKIKGNR